MRYWGDVGDVKGGKSGGGVMGVRCSSRISSVVFLVLKEYGSGVICLILEVKRLANL